MFSLTLFVSNLGFLTQAKAFSYLSIPIVIGIIFSPDGIIPILPSTREDLSWALKVALTWTTFLAGTQLSKKTPYWGHVMKLLPIFLGYSLFYLISLILISYFAQNILNLEFFSNGNYSPQALALALLLSSALFSSQENPFLLSMVFVSLFFVFNSPEQNFQFADLVLPLGIGLIMGAVCRLIISPESVLDTPSRLTLVGLAILGTGWTVGLGSLEVLFGLSLGWALSFIHKYGICKDPNLKASDIPIRFIVALFAGLFIKLSITLFIIGLSLALFRLLIKYLLLNTGLRTAEDLEVLTSLLPISKLALPILLSLHLSPYSNHLTSFTLGSFCIGFITNDIITLLIEIYKTNTLTKKEALI